MLRRKPTAITITSEDLIAFEEERLRQQQSKENNNQNRDSSSAGNFYSSSAAFDPNDELKPLPGDKARILSKWELRNRYHTSSTRLIRAIAISEESTSALQAFENRPAAHATTIMPRKGSTQTRCRDSVFQARRETKTLLQALKRSQDG
ncbi:hypothetical protein FQN53_008303 [Emmonsiellopsis sp. PD_33]|nr:hypothetical protein FQN53_008303 [Emmonsiellopsis sp. PD_33]